MPKVILAVTNDLLSDQRVDKVARFLVDSGCQVCLVGRRLPESPDLAPRAYQTHRMRLLFSRGPLFYAEFNIRLFLFLLVRRAHAITANDLDSLPACWLAARLRGRVLVFDSHELFEEVPELQHRPGVKRCWQALADGLIPRVDAAMTVSESIASYLQNRHGIPFHIIPNLPASKNPIPGGPDTGSTAGKKVILYQGALNLGRGVELMIDAMEYLPGFVLMVVGTGDLHETLQALAREKSWAHRIHFVGRVPFEELRSRTGRAELGLSLEEDLGLNYRFALPNKLFDYIQARIPVIVSDLPEMARLVRDYRVGEVLVTRNPRSLADLILQVSRARNGYATSLEHAANALCWEKMADELRRVYQTILA